MEDRCVCCGDIVPEGRMVCRICEQKAIAGQQMNGRRMNLSTGKNSLLKKLFNREEVK